MKLAEEGLRRAEASGKETLRYVEALARLVRAYFENKHYIKASELAPEALALAERLSALGVEHQGRRRTSRLRALKTVVHLLQMSTAVSIYLGENAKAEEVARSRRRKKRGVFHLGFL